MNVSHQLENRSGHAELAPLNESIQSHALMSEAKQKEHDTSMESQLSATVTAGARILELESILETSARADDSGIEELKQRIAASTFGLEAREKSSAAASAACELQIARLLARIDTFENEAKSAEYKAQFILEASNKDREELERVTFDL
eukprot:8879714-Heterocapsa_arctica.AAC.1